jgi:hypothetical protein
VAAARIVLLAGGGVLVAYLLWQARRPAPVGTALQVTALSAPTVHAWYLTWGLPMMGTAGPRAQRWTVAVCVALCFTALPDPLSRRPAGIALTVVLLAAALAAVALPAIGDRLAVRRTDRRTDQQRDRQSDPRTDQRTDQRADQRTDRQGDPRTGRRKVRPTGRPTERRTGRPTGGAAA